METTSAPSSATPINRSWLPRGFRPHWRACRWCRLRSLWCRTRFTALLLIQVSRWMISRWCRLRHILIRSLSASRLSVSYSPQVKLSSAAAPLSGSCLSSCSGVAGEFTAQTAAARTRCKLVAGLAVSVPVAALAVPSAVIHPFPSMETSCFGAVPERQPSAAAASSSGSLPAFPSFHLV